MKAAALALLVPLCLSAQEHPREHPGQAEPPAPPPAEGTTAAPGPRTAPGGSTAAASPAGPQRVTPEEAASYRPPPTAGAGLPERRVVRRNKDFSEAVSGYVRAQEEALGGLEVEDPVLKRAWKLRLLRVHEDRVVEPEPGLFFACADLAEVGGRAKLDLDFYARRKGLGSWRIEKVLIHKVNGKPRYGYDAKNRMVPAP